MSDPIWSKVFAHRVAEFLGYRMPKGWATATEPGWVDLDPEAEGIVEELTEAFRYLPPRQAQELLDYAEFLRGHKIVGVGAEHLPVWVREKLREVCDLALFLRQRYGTARPADEQDSWTEEDKREFTASGLDVWDEREAAGGA